VSYVDLSEHVRLHLLEEVGYSSTMKCVLVFYIVFQSSKEMFVRNSKRTYATVRGPGGWDSGKHALRGEWAVGTFYFMGECAFKFLITS